MVDGERQSLLVAAIAWLERGGSGFPTDSAMAHMGRGEGVIDGGLIVGQCPE